MPEKIVPITLEMFKPRPEDRSSRTNTQLAFFMSHFSGRGRFRYHSEMRLGRPLPKDMAEKIDEEAFSAIKKIYNLPGDGESHPMDPQEFYLQQQRQARGVISYIARIFPETAGDFELKDEVTYCSDRPSDLFRLISRPPEKIDPVLAYELQRHVLFAHISGLSNARSLRARSRSFLAEKQALFNENLFEGVEGAGERHIVESVNDDETNEVIGFREDMGRMPVTAHLKLIPETVRSIPGIGLVHTSPRKKDDGNTVIKAVVKAYEKNAFGVIDINSVQDSLGMMFCLMDPHASTEKLIARVYEVVESGPRKIIDSRRRDEVGGARGQSPNFQFSRLEIQFEDMPTWFELIFRTTKQYVNAKVEVGRRDSRGYFDGASHELFEARRAAMLLPLFFPSEIYNHNTNRQMDLDRIVVSSMKRMAEGLRGRYRS